MYNNADYMLLNYSPFILRSIKTMKENYIQNHIIDITIALWGWKFIFHLHVIRLNC